MGADFAWSAAAALLRWRLILLNLDHWQENLALRLLLLAQLTPVQVGLFFELFLVGQSLFISHLSPPLAHDKLLFLL